MTEIRFFDGNLNLTLIADDIISATVESKWQENGTFTATLPLTERYFYAIHPTAANSASAKYAMAAGESFIIDSTCADRMAGTLTVSGRSLTALLDAGALETSAPAEDTPAAVIASLITAAAILPFAVTLTAVGALANISYRADYSGLADAVGMITRATDTACRIDLAPAGGGCNLTVAPLRDRTDLTLSEDSGGMYPVSLTTDFADYYNSARLIGAEKSGIARHSILLTAAECGFADGYNDSAAPTRTLSVDAGAVRAARYLTGDADGELTSYYNAMRQFGRAILAAHRPVRELTAVLDGGWEDMISVGDRVNVASARFALNAPATVQRKSVSTTAEGTTVTVALRV